MPFQIRDIRVFEMMIAIPDLLLSDDGGDKINAASTNTSLTCGIFEKQSFDHPRVPHSHSPLSSPMLSALSVPAVALPPACMELPQAMGSRRLSDADAGTTSATPVLTYVVPDALELS